MTARRAVASILGAAAVVLVSGCGQRSAVWNTALADTECHASDTIVRKLKEEPGKYVVYACGQELVYRCDETSNTCAHVPDPASAPVTTGESPEATPVVPSLEGPAPREEPAPPDASAPGDAPPDAEPADETAPQEPPSDDAAPDDTDASGDVPEPP